MVDPHGNAPSTMCFYARGSISCNMITLLTLFHQYKPAGGQRTTPSQPQLPSIRARRPCFNQNGGQKQHIHGLREFKRNHQEN